VEGSPGGLITNPGLMERRLSRTEVTVRLPFVEGTEMEGIPGRLGEGGSSKVTGRERFLTRGGRWLLLLSTEEVRGGGWIKGGWIIGS